MRWCDNCSTPAGMKGTLIKGNAQKPFEAITREVFICSEKCFENLQALFVKEERRENA